MSSIKDTPLRHRDLSWLSFNYRVLQEAKDPRNPLLERLKFLAIFSNNLNEFYSVRVAHHRNLVKAGKKTKKALDFQPKTVLKNIIKIVNKHQLEFSHIFQNQIIPELKKEGIEFVSANNYSDSQRVFVDAYFADNLLPFVQPILLRGEKIKPFLNNAAVYLATVLEDKEDSNTIEFALVNVPSDRLDRFVILPTHDETHKITMLDEIVRHSIIDLFPGYKILGCYSIKISRDAELYIDDEFSGNLVQKIKTSLAKRKVGPASRTVFDRNIPPELLKYLINIFDIEKIDLHPEGRYHNNFDFLGFPDFDKTPLLNRKLEPIALDSASKSVFNRIDERDLLLYYPYHEYNAVLDFFKEAINDPDVTHIKVTQYRVAAQSAIMDTLLKGVKLGKQITVFIEVKARFDEEANLSWGEKLEQAGIKVIYSFPGLKVHCKLALVIKNKNDKDYYYNYLSTGNFNEKTAKIYCDYGYFTSDQVIGSEVLRVFSFLETVNIPTESFKKLFVGQFNLREKIYEKIDQEIEHARAGNKAYIIFKLNSLEDKEMIEKLYSASQEGVQIDLIIRGICCLMPGIEGVSENIKVRSIVDRYLEHARVYHFHNHGEKNTYLSSADLMTRNLNYRIEVAFPVENLNCRKDILEILKYQLRDNVKARIIDINENNSYAINENDVPFQSQLETYYYYKRKELN